MTKQAGVVSDCSAQRASDSVGSLGERAAIAARAELRGERTGILGAIGEAPLGPLARPRRVPESWSFLHVMERMEEGFRVLGRLPVATRPRGYVNSMPIYMEENRKLQDRRHGDTTAALRDLGQKLDKHAAAVEVIQPTVAALALSRSRLATLASVGLAAALVLGWVVEAGVKWAFSTLLSHLH
jgi:hypothetical protein